MKHPLQMYLVSVQLTETKEATSYGSGVFRVVQAKVYGNYGNMRPIQASPFGFDSNPLPSTVGVYSNTTVNGMGVMVGYLGVSNVAQSGESRMYATNSGGSVVGYVYCKANGELNLLGDSNWAVKYTELATQFNELKGKFNDLVSKWNSFCTNYVPGSPTTTGTPATLAGQTASSSTADITQSKNERIKTN